MALTVNNARRRHDLLKYNATEGIKKTLYIKYLTHFQRFMASTEAIYFVTFHRYHDYEDPTLVTGHVRCLSKRSAIRSGQRQVYASFVRSYRYFDANVLPFSQWLISIEDFKAKYEKWKNSPERKEVERPHHWCTDACDMDDDCPGAIFERASKERRLDEKATVEKSLNAKMMAPYDDMMKMYLTLNSVQAKKVDSLINVFKG